MRAFLCAFATSLTICGSAICQTPPPEISAVQKYILDKDYPEVFGDTRYRAKVQNAVIADLDGDGRAEVILHYMPHYRQSPTVVIYRVAPNMTVTRVKEGLAPGPLQPLTGDFLDSHELGEAADIHIPGQGNDAPSLRKFVQSAWSTGMSIVAYPNFFHTDSRVGAGVYVDMTGLAAPPKSRTCEDFEFSTVEQISAGSVSALGQGNALAAWVGNKVYLYRIKSFPAPGFLDKEMWTVDVPAQFHGFAAGAGGPLKYVTALNEEKPFDVECNDRHCTLPP